MMVQEMMEFMVNIGLFDKSTNDRIRCFTLAKRLDDTNSKNPQIRKILDCIDGKNSELLGENPNDSEKLLLDKTRLEEIRVNNKNNKELSASPPVNQKKKVVKKVDPLDYSVMQMTNEEVQELIRIRKQNNRGGKITQRIINSLAKEFAAARLMSYTNDELLTEFEVRGWKTFKSDWIKPKNNSVAGSYSNGQTNTTRLSAVDRSRQAINENRARRGLGPVDGGGHVGEALAPHVVDVRPQISEPVRADTGRHVGALLEGDFWPADS